MSNESVKIDKYVLKTEKSPKIIIFDNDLQKNIVSVNTLDSENNLLLAEMILAELNTGKYEPVVEGDTDDGLGENDIIDVGDSVHNTGDSVPNTMDSELNTDDESNGDLNND